MKGVFKGSVFFVFCGVLFTGCVPRIQRDLPLYDSGAPLRVTALTATKRLNESAVLGFGGSLSPYDMTFLSPEVAPGMRASLFFTDKAEENISKDPACALSAPPYPTTLCGAQVFIQYVFEDENLTVVVPAPLVSVNAFDPNRIDFLVPDPKTIQPIPGEYTLKSGAVLLKFKGRWNDINDLVNRQGPKPAITLSTDPSIFLDHWGRAKITRADESLVNELNSASPGERLTIWGTGFEGESLKAPHMDGWKLTMECDEHSKREVPILSAEQVANTPGVQKLTFEVPEPQGKVYEKGFCGLTLNQGGRSTFALLSVNAPPPAVERLESLFRYANGAPFSARSTTNNLVPGSFTVLEFSNILCPGFLQGELAKAYPKPTEVCGVQFLFRGESGKHSVAAPIYSTIEGIFEPKILLQVPLELTGETRGTITVVVGVREKSSTSVSFAEMTFLPLGLRREQESPASKGFLPGETVQLNGIGLGQTHPPMATNTGGGAQYQFPDLTLHLTGKTLAQPVPIELLSATKEATGDAAELPHFERLTSSDIPHHYNYDGPLLRDWIRFKLPTTVKAGRYTLHICQRGKCQALQPFRLLPAAPSATRAK